MEIQYIILVKFFIQILCKMIFFLPQLNHLSPTFY